MFSHFRSAPISRVCTRRSFSCTCLTRNELSSQLPSDTQSLQETSTQQGHAELGSKDRERRPETYREFMNTIGAQFRNADEPNKWLGNRVPFPMNPTFKPPPPVSDTVRTALYEEFMEDPVVNNVRELSQRYHLSLKRVHAILRLKGMEQAWIKGKQLQTGFQIGMEKILGVFPSHVHLSHIESRTDTHEADTLEQDENRDAARQRYVRLYWESVPEDGREPIVPLSLENAKLGGKRFAAAQEAYKSNPRLMPHVSNPELKRPNKKIQFVRKQGRPTIKFVDVGGKFIDVDERLRRMAISERRARVRAGKAQKLAASASDSGHVPV